VYRGGTIGKPITDITEDTNEKTVSFKFMGGIDSGIEIITANNKNNNFYTLDGRKVGNDISLLKNGIYISNGKKIIVK
jgi:immune inhibitor A